MGNVSIAAASRGYGKFFFVAILRDTMGFFCFVGLFFAPFRPNQGKQRERQAVWLAFFVFGILAGLYPRFDLDG